MQKQRKKDRLFEVLAFIDQFIQKNNFSPTIRDIKEGLGFSTPSHVHYYLTKLQENKFISHKEQTARTIRILPDGETLLATKQKPAQAQKPAPVRTAVYVNCSAHISATKPQNTLSLPVLGRTFGGPTTMMFSSDFQLPFFDPESRLTISPEMIPPGIPKSELFALEVQGNSMIGAHIKNGDFIILRKTEHADRGDMVVVWLDDTNETTLKYFMPEKDYICLEPANEAVSPILIKGAQLKSLRIIGKVVRVVCPEN